MISMRLALRLSLGILCGLALVLLPAVFSATQPLSANPNPYADVNGTASGQPHPGQYLPPIYRLSGSTLSGSAGLSILVIVFFIFLPSTVFSLFIRRWAERRSRDYL